MESHTRSSIQFLSGGGEMGELTRSFDWAKTAVGEIETWPQSLRTTLSILLNSKFPMFLWWGKNLTCFYNDAYRPSLGQNGKHPFILGQDAKIAWPEIWHIIQPLIQQVIDTGEATWHEDLLVPIYRNGHIEDVYWTFSYSPVIAESGDINGVLVVCNETTGKVESLKKLEESEQKFRNNVSQAPVGIAVLRGADFIVETANSAYLELVGKTEKEFVGKKLFDVLPEVKEIVAPLLIGVLHSQQPFNARELGVNIHRYGRKELAYFNLVYHPMADGNGGISGIMVVATEVTELVKNKFLLEQSEKQFRSVVMHSPVPMAVFMGRDLVITMANNIMFTKLWRKKEEEVMGKKLLEVFPELKAQKFPQLLQEVFNSGLSHYESEAIAFVEGDDGNRQFYLDFEYAPLFDPQNEVTGIMVTVNDVTEKVMAREKFKEAEERVRLATEGTGIATWDLDLRNKLLISSPGIARIFGYDEGARITYTQTKEHIHQSDQKLVEDAMTMALEKGFYEYEARIIRTDNIQRWIRTKGRVLYDNDGGAYRMLGTMLDITENKSAEEQLARLAAIVKTSGDAIISKKLDGTITSWNDSAQRIFGYSAEEMIGEHIGKLFPPDRFDEERGIINLIKKGQRVEHFESQRLTKDGRLLDISLSISPVYDRLGKIVGVSKIARDITKQKLTERIISENEERLEVLMNASELGTWELDLVTRQAGYSAKYLEMTGFKADDKPVADELIKLVHPDDLELRGKAFAEALKTGNLAYEFRMVRHNDSELRWLEVQGRVLMDEKNRPAKMLGTIRDITDAKNKRDLIAESESRLRIAALSSELGTWDYNPSTEVLRWDDASRSLFGVDRETPITVDLFFSKMHPDDRERALAKMQDALEPDIASTYDVEYRTIGWPDGEVKWIHAKGKAFFNEEKKPIHFAGTVLDVTEKRNALEELKESEQKFRLLADSMPQHIWTGDTEGNLNYFNQSVYNYSGLTPAQVTEGGWLQIVHPDDRKKNIEQWLHAINTGEDFLLEHRFRRHDGEYRWQLSRAIPQKDSEGKIQMWVGTSTDVHEQKTFSEDLEKNVEIRTLELKTAINDLLKTNQELEQFAYVSTHDLQEPLRKIQTFANMLIEKGYTDDRNRIYVEKINSSAARMADLINDLLAYSKLSKAEQLVDTDLGLILDKVKNDFELLISEKHARIVAGKLPVIKAVPIQMNQLIYNHIGNSLKFCETNPVIEISSHVAGSDEIKKIPQLDPEKTYVHLQFKDNGIGFDNDYNTRIFTIFQRLHAREKYSGTGIGLAMCKKIVENHHGHISADSAPGKGATFNIYLPA